MAIEFGFRILYIVLICSISTIAGGIPKQQKLDRIRSLPGQPTVNFSQFSGYVTVNNKHGRSLFYWLIEAVDSPEKKPLVLWLNGGPGCSSLAYGASEEIGPFRINKSGASLYLNKYSWNSDANLLFLESPAGVGFSYTNTSSNLNDSGDKRTAEDNLKFIIRWLSRFPNYKRRVFYIAGESYAGHYIPQLAKKILDLNNRSTKPLINLKGFMVGNGVTDNYYDNIGTVSFWWSHSIISDATYHGILNNCDFKGENLSTSCNDVVKYALEHEFGNIDQYSIYTPPCPSSNTTVRRLSSLHHALLRRRVAGYDPCTETYAEVYFNRPEVQRAMHANGSRILYRWTSCSDVLIKNWKDSQTTMLPTYKELIRAGLKIWVFSGDTDTVVPVTATRFSINHLRLRVKTRWYPWYCNGQVGGWTEVYEGLTFGTVRGAGHEVPHFQPLRALTLFRSFLAGEELPRS